MEKENALEIEITKINSEYSLAIVKKMNRKVIDSKEWQEFWAKVRAGEIGND